MCISAFIVSTQSTSFEMNILVTSAPCFGLVSGFSCETTRGIMQKPAEQSLVAYERSFSAKQGNSVSLLALLRQPPKTWGIFIVGLGSLGNGWAVAAPERLPLGVLVLVLEVAV